jgi:exonuclease III
MIGARIRKANAKLIVIIGDYDRHSDRNDLDIEGTGARFHCADLFEALHTEAGLIDLLRAQHGGQQEWTWRSSVNGFRIDHAFGDKAFIGRFDASLIMHHDCRLDRSQRHRF